MNAHEAETRLAELLRLVEERDERIRVYRNGKPVAEIGPITTADRDLLVPNPRLSEPNALNFADEERCELSALLDAGFVDLYAHRHPDGRDRFTYWNYRWNRDSLRYGVRLDLILATRRVVDRVRAIRVDMDYRKPIDGLRPSECAPVIADLDD